MSISGRSHSAAIPVCLEINLTIVPFSRPHPGAVADVSLNRLRVMYSGTRYRLFEQVAKQASAWIYRAATFTQFSAQFMRFTPGNVDLKWCCVSHECELIHSRGRCWTNSVQCTNAEPSFKQLEGIHDYDVIS